MISKETTHAYVPLNSMPSPVQAHSSRQSFDSTGRPSIDRGISLGMESRQVFYCANSGASKWSNAGKIQSPEEAQMEARKAFYSNFSKMFGL